MINVSILCYEIIKSKMREVMIDGSYLMQGGPQLNQFWLLVYNPTRTWWPSSYEKNQMVMPGHGSKPRLVMPKIPKTAGEWMVKMLVNG